MSPAHRNIVIPKGTVTEDKITVIKIPVTSPENNTPLVVINKNELYSPNIQKSDLQRNQTDQPPPTSQPIKSDRCLQCEPCKYFPDNTPIVTCDPCSSPEENPAKYVGSITESAYKQELEQNRGEFQQSICSDKKPENSCPCGPGAPVKSTFSTPAPAMRPCPLTADTSRSKGNAPPAQSTFSAPAKSAEPVTIPCPLTADTSQSSVKPERKPCPAFKGADANQSYNDDSPVQPAPSPPTPYDLTLEEPCPCDPGALCKGSDCNAPQPVDVIVVEETVKECPSTAPVEFPICPKTVDDEKTSEYATDILRKAEMVKPKPPVKKVKKGNEQGLIVNRYSMNINMIRPYRAPDGLDPLPCKGKLPKKDENCPTTFIPCPSVDFVEKVPEVIPEPDPCPDPNIKIIKVGYKQYSQTDDEPVEGTSFMYEDPNRQGLSEVAFSQLAKSVLQEPPKKVEPYRPPAMCTDQRYLIDAQYLNEAVAEPVAAQAEPDHDDSDCTC